MSHGVADVTLVLQSVTWSYRVSHVTGCNRLSRGVTECHMVSQSVTWCDRASHGVTECHMLPQSVTWCHRASHGATECRMLLQGVIRCYMVLHGITWCCIVFVDSETPQQKRTEDKSTRTDDVIADAKERISCAVCSVSNKFPPKLTHVIYTPSAAR